MEQSTQTDDVQTKKFDQSVQTDFAMDYVASDYKINSIDDPTCEQGKIVSSNLELLNNTFQKHQLFRSLPKKGSQSSCNGRFPVSLLPLTLRHAPHRNPPGMYCPLMMDELDHVPLPPHTPELDSVTVYATNFSASYDEESPEIFLLSSAAAAIVRK